MKRDEAFALLKEHVHSESLIKHSLAVEAAMIGYSKKFNADVERWSCCGVLHDLDFEKYPEEHPLVAVKWLTDMGFDDEFVIAIKGHGDHTHTPRTTDMAKTLYAVDELASFIVAVALVRPDKFVGLTSKSVKKKLKDKAFARAVNREIVQKGAEEMSVDFTEHIDFVIKSLFDRELELNNDGLSLL